MQEKQERKFVADDHVVFCDLDEGSALLDLKSSKYYNLNQTAGFVWKRLSEPSSIDALVDSMMVAYDVDESMCRADIAGVLASFEKIGLVSIAP